MVIPQKLDREITEKHLQDTSLYRPSSFTDVSAQYRRLNGKWVKVAKDANLPPSIISRLKIDLPVCPVLYLLIKTHKLSDGDMAPSNPSKFKVRSIIRCIGGPSDRISWFLNLVLVQRLTYIPAHLTKLII